MLGLDVSAWGMADFRKLKVWQKAHVLAMDIHEVAGTIRAGDLSSLRSQMIRAGLSIPTNIVEGCGQSTGRQFIRFLKIALNSSSELEYHLIVAQRLRAISEPGALALKAQVIEVRKMLHGLIRHITARIEKKRGKRGDETAEE